MTENRTGKDMTPASEVREHLYSLEASGWTAWGVAKHVGIAQSTVSAIRCGRTTWTETWLAELILAVPVDSTASPTFVSSVGTVRRIQALLAMGHSRKEMCDFLGRNVVDSTRTNGPWVYRKTHDDVKRMYRELVRKPGRNAVTAARAKRLGYPSPAQWDDIDNDEAPEEAA